ncbi:MAG: esterase-like activity of phytase family protein [Bacteroidota bacterium]
MKHEISFKRYFFILFLGLSCSLFSELSAQKKDKLTGRAVLNAKSFANGPTSGTVLGDGPINGQFVPFINKQPVQGVSAALKSKRGEFLVMSDNGFGALENSADYNLRVYTIKPSFRKSKKGKGGGIQILDYFELRDPDKKIPFAIVNHFTEDRILTGADFDIESFQKAKDGTFWFGDEFGPFLIHTTADGKVLDAPISLPDFDHPGQEIRAPQNPFNEEYSAVRVLNAMRKHALNNGNANYPVFSPWFVMLDDDNENTTVGSRLTPPSDLKGASSEVFNVRSIQRAGFPVVVYTVNDAENMNNLLELGVDGIISDRPDILLEVLKTYDGNKDGRADFMDESGLINQEMFDAQGHRGARNLRPENTLPSIEAALDYLMTTLEFDCGITKDNIAVLDHDPYIEAGKVRKSDGSAYEEDDEVLVKDLTLAQIQQTFIADKLLSGRPAQTNDLNLSPVSVAFANAYGLMDPYVMPSLQQVFEFVRFYKNYYQFGVGAGTDGAETKWKNAARIRYNIETKLNPRTDADDKGNTFVTRTKEPIDFVDAIGATITAYGLQQEADIQSFDFRSLLLVHENYPQIRTVCLFGDFPKSNGAGDGTNLQDQNGRNTPWLAGLYWPYRVTSQTAPFRSQSSGGFEGMALTKDKRTLLPLLEKPLVGGPEKELLIHEFDIRNRAYTGTRYTYQLDEDASAIGDFILFSRNRGLIIERDGSQGDLDGFKKTFEIKLDFFNKVAAKGPAIDLLDIKDSRGISAVGALPGDVGLGKSFAFPFVTIESVIHFNNRKVGILNDNNYPFSVGRHVGTGLPDDNEFILLRPKKRLGRAKIGLKMPQQARATESVVADATGEQSETLLELSTEVYPNPFQSLVSIQLDNAFEGVTTISLIDSKGAEVWSQQQVISEAQQVVSLDLSQVKLMKERIYLLKVHYANGMSEVHRLLKE